MPIDINLLRKSKGGDPDKVKESEMKRGRNTDHINKIMLQDEEWIKKKFQLDQMRKDKNNLSKMIKQLKEEKKSEAEVEEINLKAKKMNEEIEKLEKEEEELSLSLKSQVKKIGNIVDASVKASSNEEENIIVKTYGNPNKDWVIDGTFGNLHHHEIMTLLDIVDTERGQKIAGHRAYFLKDAGVLLNQALINYSLDMLVNKRYTILQTPYFMNHSIMNETCQLSDFQDTLYKVITQNENEPAYLIATSEQPISGYFYKEWLNEKDLPIRFGGFSSCFRKEAGAHGKDLWGIFRIHQFEKVEQFCITTPETSWAMHEEMISVCEEYYKGLELPFRIVNIVAVELNDAAAKKYDLEAWFPGYHNYRELVSCSNCTDFQSRGLEVRCGSKKNDIEKRYVHMLNCTLCATERTMCCILENYQEKNGVRIPKALIPYMHGITFLPYKVTQIEALKDLQKLYDKALQEEQKKGKKDKKDKKEKKDKKDKEEKKDQNEIKESHKKKDKKDKKKQGSNIPEEKKGDSEVIKPKEDPIEIAQNVVEIKKE